MKACRSVVASRAWTPENRAAIERGGRNALKVAGCDLGTFKMGVEGPKQIVDEDGKVLCESAYEVFLTAEECASA